MKYAKVTLESGKKIILRVHSISDTRIHGTKVNKEGDEILINGKVNQWFLTLGDYTKIVELEMDKKYAVLEEKITKS